MLFRSAQAAATAPAGQWILGRGWDQNDWSDRTGFPNALDLDEVAPDHPVALTRVDGHALWVNSAALTRARIDAKTRPRAGGRVVMKDGAPTGIFIDNAMELIRTHIPPLTPEQLEEAVRRGQAECLASGLTGVHDMGVGLRELCWLHLCVAEAGGARRRGGQRLHQPCAATVYTSAPYRRWKCNRRKNLQIGRAHV